MIAVAYFLTLKGRVGILISINSKLVVMRMIINEIWHAYTWLEEITRCPY